MQPDKEIEPLIKERILTNALKEGPGRTSEDYVDNPSP
jgi:hypothetical protein